MMSEGKKTRPQDRWDAKAGVKTRSCKLHTEIADQFRDACKDAGVSQAGALENLMKEFIERVNHEKS
jgi:hypothetical protein